MQAWGGARVSEFIFKGSKSKIFFWWVGVGGEARGSDFFTENPNLKKNFYLLFFFWGGEGGGGEGGAGSGS